MTKLADPAGSVVRRAATAAAADAALARLPLPLPSWALFLDVDGTLLDLAPAPDEVVVPDGLREILADLHRLLGGAAALVSGRSLAGIDRLFAPLRLPAAGQHGAELRSAAEVGPGAGEEAEAPSDPLLGQLEERFAAFAVATPGILVENKGVSLAVHYRQAPEHRAAVLRFVEQTLAEVGGGFEILPAKMAFDLRLRGANKGIAIAALMRQPPFAGRTPIFFGDDRTDEDGFAAILAAGGYAVHVGTENWTMAPLRVPDPPAVRAWLEMTRDRLCTIAGEHGKPQEPAKR